MNKEETKRNTPEYLSTLHEDLEEFLLPRVRKDLTISEFSDLVCDVYEIIYDSFNGESED
jgi:hypothetical protein